MLRKSLEFCDGWASARVLIIERTCQPFALPTQALDLLTNQIGADVPPELWNNIGALRHQLGDLTGAKEAFEHAQAAMTIGPDSDKELKEVQNASLVPHALVVGLKCFSAF